MMLMYPTRLTPPKKPRRSHRKKLVLTSLIILVAGAYSAIVISRPFSQLQPTLSDTSLSVTTPASNLPWPAYGSGAFGLIDGSVVATHGEQTPVPIASAAKVITALVILEKHPLTAGASGPTITMTQTDVDLYNQYVRIQGSVTPVAVGQKLTERQMLQALLLPSANNIADSLALWSFGSISGYLQYANNFLKQNKLENTRVGGDASGYLNDSVSTTTDLVKIGAKAMRSPALAEIVSQKTAFIPGTGTVTNYNNLLGSNGIVGIKTGNNDGNGGVFIGAAKVNVQGTDATVITALSGAPNLGRVLRDSGILLAAAPANFANTTIVKKGTVLGTYRQANGSLLQAIVNQDINTVVLRGNSVKATLDLRPISYNTATGSSVGSITVPATNLAATQTVPITLKQAPTKPGVIYRLTHP